MKFEPKDFGEQYLDIFDAADIANRKLELFKIKLEEELNQTKAHNLFLEQVFLNQKEAIEEYVTLKMKYQTLKLQCYNLYSALENLRDSVESSLLLDEKLADDWGKLKKDSDEALKTLMDSVIAKNPSNWKEY